MRHGCVVMLYRDSRNAPSHSMHAMLEMNGAQQPAAPADTPPPATADALAGGSLQRQFFFIQGGQLQETPTVRDLLRPLDPVRNDETCETILLRFLADEALYALPVVDAGRRPVGLIDRKHYIEFFSKRYTREIFGRRSIVDLFEHRDYRHNTPIVGEEDCSVEDVAKIIIDAGMHHMVTGFIVSNKGHYLGVANGHDLLNIITQRKQAELYYLAHYDSLTGVPNRTLFADRLEQACRDAERRKKPLALLYIDVDRFKQVNDSLGHSAGDAVLRKVVERLKASARRTDTVARLAGDEFVILMEQLADISDVAIVAGRLLQLMADPIELHGHSVVTTVSIGSAIYPTDDTAMEVLLGKADAAMYEAKAAGRNGHRAYSPETVMYNPQKMLLENDLRLAIERGELVLHFQPQVGLVDRQIPGVEALVRWQHPERGLVPPGHFIPIAEESGLIVPLGEWVVHAACRQIKAWQDSGVQPLRVSVNISALQFHQRTFPEFLKRCLTEYNINPRFIELELTESALMHNVDDVLHTLKEIKSLGFSLAIDDFGTGFSSLSYLRRFPIDRLKIDQSFVRDIEKTPVNASIAKAIISLANSLSLDIIAEGIENPSEKNALEHMGCAEGQGYLFAKPLTADELVAWLATQGNNAEHAVSA